MKALVLLPLMGMAVLGSPPVQAQSNPFLNQVDSILLEKGPADFTIFPEDALRERTGNFSDAVDRFQSQIRFPDPPINRPDLPTPYNATLGSQAGYYQVTLSQPSFVFIRP